MKPVIKISLILGSIILVIGLIMVLTKKKSTPKADVKPKDAPTGDSSFVNPTSNNDRPPLNQGSRGVLVEYIQRAVNQKYNYTPALATNL